MNDKATLYRNLPPAKQALYDGSDERTNLLSTISERENFSPEEHVAFVQLFGDVILGIHADTDVAAELQTAIDITAEQAAAIATELQPLLTEQAPAPVEAPLTDTTSESSASDEPEEPSVADPTAVTPLRTFEGDMQKVHGYGVSAPASEEVAETPAENEATATSPNNSTATEVATPTNDPVHKSTQSDSFKNLEVADAPSYHKANE